MSKWKFKIECIRYAMDINGSSVSMDKIFKSAELISEYFNEEVDSKVDTDELKRETLNLAIRLSEEGSSATVENIIKNARSLLNYIIE